MSLFWYLHSWTLAKSSRNYNLNIILNTFNQCNPYSLEHAFVLLSPALPPVFLLLYSYELLTDNSLC